MIPSYYAADHRPSHRSCDDSAAAAMIDDYAMTAAAAWNFSLSTSAPDRWSVADLAVHCRRTALGPGRSAPPSRSRILGALQSNERKKKTGKKALISDRGPG